MAHALCALSKEHSLSCEGSNWVYWEGADFGVAMLRHKRAKLLSLS